jgi:hypothetical protein
VIANHDLIEVVRSSNREFAISEEIAGDAAAESGATIEQGRGQLTQEVFWESRSSTSASSGSTTSRKCVWRSMPA